MLTAHDQPILVTGASGFVGSHLVEELLAQGHRVRCMVRRSSDLSYIRDLPVALAYGDVLDEDSVREASKGISAVCHCAALSRALDEGTFMRVNAEGTARLAAASLELNPNLSRFLYVSSVSAAGPSRDADDHVDEARRPDPITWYGKSKLAAEQALLDMDSQLPLTIVRPAPVFGPRDKDFLTYFELVNRRLSLKLGRRERRLSLIYVRDLARLATLALHSEVARGNIYNASTLSTSYTEFSDAIAHALDRATLNITLPEAVLTPMSLWARAQARITGRPPLLNEQRIIDMREHYWLCSGEKAARELGFQAEYNLDTAVRETADWYRENGWL